MVGHTLKGVDLAYYNRDPTELKELYFKYLPHLTFFEKTIEVRSLDTKDSQRLEELDKENKELRKELQDIRQDINTRKGTDDTLEALFSDPEVRNMLLKKVKELKIVP